MQIKVLVSLPCGETSTPEASMLALPTKLPSQKAHSILRLKARTALSRQPKEHSCSEVLQYSMLKFQLLTDNSVPRRTKRCI